VSVKTTTLALVLDENEIMGGYNTPDTTVNYTIGSPSMSFNNVHHNTGTLLSTHIIICATLYGIYGTVSMVLSTCTKLPSYLLTYLFNQSS